MAAAG